LFNILNISVRDMYFQDIGVALRKARLSRGLTQNELATQANVSRGTVNQLETGVFPDLGVKKLLALLNSVGLEMFIQDKSAKPAAEREMDYLAMACTSANVSYKGKLEPEVLARTLLTGKVPPKMGPYLRVVFDEVPAKVFNGLVRQVSLRSTKPEKVLQHVREVGEAIHSSRQHYHA
jgi:transcriptional regulator with XRE-family HTH domain